MPGLKARLTRLTFKRAVARFFLFLIWELLLGCNRKRICFLQRSASRSLSIITHKFVCGFHIIFSTPCLRPVLVVHPPSDCLYAAFLKSTRPTTASPCHARHGMSLALLCRHIGARTLEYQHLPASLAEQCTIFQKTVNLCTMEPLNLCLGTHHRPIDELMSKPHPFEKQKRYKR